MAKWAENGQESLFFRKFSSIKNSNTQCITILAFSVKFQNFQIIR